MWLYSLFIHYSHLAVAFVALIRDLLFFLSFFVSFSVPSREAKAILVMQACCVCFLFFTDPCLLVLSLLVTAALCVCVRVALLAAGGGAVPQRISRTSIY